MRKSSSKGLILEPTCLLGPWATVGSPVRPQVPWLPWSQVLDLLRFVPPGQSSFRASPCSGTCPEMILCGVKKNIYI